MFFRKYVDRFSNGFGVVTDENRAWEDTYRQRWQHDKIVRSTHGTNCTGSCSEDLRQEWPGYVGDAADRLPSHPTRDAQP
jgi:nitrate reductase alpha subunit